MKSVFVIMGIVIVSTVVFDSCSKINKKLGLKDDNFIEENIEEQIEKHTGISVDLTPNTPE